MDPNAKVGCFRSWYEDFKHFDTRVPAPKGRRFLPHLQMGAGLVTVFASSYFGTPIADALTLIIVYGPHAFFREGLRIVDWKHGLLSNGAYLSFVGGVVRLPTEVLVWFALICAADFCSMMIQRIVQRNGRWVELAFRLLGGCTLLTFAMALYRQGFPPLHPIPLSALIGGSVLIFKSIRMSFQRIGPTHPVR